MHLKFIFILFVLFVSVHVGLFAQTYYVSSLHGSDSNSGTSQTSALKTITALNTKIGTKQNISVYFECGGMYYGKLPALKYEGTASNPVIFGAYGEGKTPVISGNKTITGWTNTGNNRWQATITDKPDAMLFLIINEKKHYSARFPNEGFKKITTTTSDGLTDNTLMQANGYWNGASIVYRKAGYMKPRNTVKSSTTAGKLVFEIIEDDWLMPTKGEEYLLQNHVNALDVDGEWVYDASNATITLQSVVNPNSLTIEYPYETGFLDLSNGNLDGHKYIIIENLSLRYYTGAAITSWYGDNIIFRNNRIEHCWEGVSMAGSNYDRPGNSLISGNYITDTNHRGISVGNLKNTKVTDNTIRRVGLTMECLKEANWPGAPTGLELGGGIINHNENDNIEISENHIDSVCYHGLVMSGNNVIAKNNVIDRAVLSYYDGGAIYMADKNLGNCRLTGNIITNTTLNLEDGYAVNAIYLDEDMKNVEIDNNTIINCRRGFQIIGTNHFIHDNVVFNFTEDFFYSLDDFNGGYTHNLIISNNHVFSQYSHNEYETYVYHFEGNPSNHQGVTNTIDNNHVSALLFGSDGFASYYETFYTRDNWTSQLGFDKNGKAEPISYEVSGATSLDEFARLVYNPTSKDTIVMLGANYLDFDGYKVRGAIKLQAFQSKILFLNAIADPYDPDDDFTGVNNAVETLHTTSLHPNPFTGTVHLTGAEGSTLQVISITGEVVHTQKVVNPDEIIFLKRPSAGMYLFRVEKDGKTKTIKAVKK